MTMCSPENHKTHMERIVNVVGEQKQANACVHLLNIVVFKANDSSCAGDLAAQATCPSNSSLITAASPTMARPTTRATKRKAGPSTSAPKKKKVEKKEKTPAAINGADWRFSKAKNKIAQDIVDGLIPSDGPINVDEIFYSRHADNPLFKDFPCREELYRNRINSLRGGIVKLKKCADFDKKAIKADRLLHPRRSHNVRGEPRWDGSDAQACLKIDMTADKLAEMTQDALWKSRPAYQLFQFVIFRKHIDQYTQSKKKHKNPRRRKKGHYGDKKLSEMQPSDTSGTLPVTNESEQSSV